MTEFPPSDTKRPAMSGITGSQPAPPASASRSIFGPLHRRRWWILVGGVVVLVSGAGTTWWLWPSTLSRTHVVPGTVQASVVSADEASTALGQTLQSRHDLSEPPPALPADPADCVVAVGPATQAVYADGWTIFGSVTYQDSDSEADHTVTQVMGEYSTSDQARIVFRRLSDGMKNCTSAVRAGGASGQPASKWFYEVAQSTADTVVWKATQDAGDDWACYRQARLKNRAILQVSVCEAGNGSHAATAIADRFASRVSG